MASLFLNVLIFSLISNVLSDTPVYYSENYAKIRYQPRENWRSHKAELNLDEQHREEVTEKLPAISAKYPQSNANNTNIDTYDTTTEPESEQINLAKFIYKNIIKDKLVVVEDKGAETTEMSDEINPMNISQDESTIMDDENVTNYNENINTDKEVITSVDEGYSEDLDQSEVSNLNQQGVYYIYHPNMLLQKVVYKTEEDSNSKKILTKIKYENIAPIVEPIYSYDPRTFVLQRLILQNQEQT